MPRLRAVITGLGMVTPLGHDAESTFEALLEGRSGVGPITIYDAGGQPVQIAAEVKEFDPGSVLPPAKTRRLDPTVVMALVAALDAEKDCGLSLRDGRPERVGVIMGSGVGGVRSMEARQKSIMSRGYQTVRPFDVPRLMLNAASSQISIFLGLRGPNWATSSACSSGAHALGSALRTIQYGDADIVLTGGTDSAITPLIIGAFAKMGAMSRRNAEPTRASRPFDRDRDGFVMGEGAVVLVLEELEHARRRGARIYCELAGFGASADAWHIATPRERGAGARACMRSALKDARLSPDDIDYINAHGTSTKLNDLRETVAIRDLFGAHADRLAVSSTKSLCGHMLGASGALEAAVCALSISRGVIHQTQNLEHPGEGCDLDYVPEGPRELALCAVLSNSLGFGGHNCTLAFRRL